MVVKVSRICRVAVVTAAFGVLVMSATGVMGRLSLGGHIIVAVVLGASMKSVVPPVRTVVESARGAIRRRLADAEAPTDQLVDVKAAYDSALAEARAELDGMRADARADAESILEQMRQAAAEEVDRIRRRGELILYSSEQRVRDLETDLSAALVDLAGEGAREPADDRRPRSESVERFLDGLEALANSAHRRPLPGFG
ncbi:F0F1 ATP synthase subunit B family protein [Nocardia sp. NPDC003693]